MKEFGVVCSYSDTALEAKEFLLARRQQSSTERARNEAELQSQNGRLILSGMITVCVYRHERRTERETGKKYAKSEALRFILSGHPFCLGAKSLRKFISDC